MHDPLELRILICVSLRKDAALIRDVLDQAGYGCQVCATVPHLMEELARGAGAVLTAEETLFAHGTEPLSRHLAAQPAWSDLPVIVLTQPGDKSRWIEGAFARFGNVTLVERPARPSTLISTARSTLRARQRQYEIRRTDQRKDEFLAMLGHELRNPLAPISAAAQLLGMAAADPAMVRRASTIIARQVQHMTSLIDDLLDVARVTRGLIKLDKATVDLRHVVADALEQVGPAIHARGHRVVLDLPPAVAAVLGDRKRLVQVVANVLHNAARYTPEGGTITVRLTVLADTVGLAVADDGIGMTPEVVERVFELFAQAESASDRSQGGLGLGLSLVHSLVESHGGSVHAHSEGLGQGSTFTLHLPRIDPQAAAAPESAGAPAAVVRRDAPLRVLIVDDNADAATTLEMLLTNAGYDVSVQFAAHPAIAHARASQPQVCLLDLGLPDLDGTELARHLRAMPETASSMLIAVTGYGQDEDRERSKSAGFDHHFVKPVDAAHLLQLLAAVT